MKKTVYVDGMHCPSCDVLVKDRLSTCQNITSVKTSYKHKTAEIEYTDSISLKALDKAVKQYGYTVHLSEKSITVMEPLSKRLFDVGAIAVLLVILYFFAQEFRIIPDFAGSAAVTVTGAFILGLIASTSTCMATSGSLFLLIIGKQKKSEEDINEKVQNKGMLMRSALLFIGGRVASYAAFGLFAGLVGGLFQRNIYIDTILMGVVAVIMIAAGLEMAGIMFTGGIFGEQRKKLFTYFEKKLSISPSKTAFFLGAITVILPCGFTQTVQAYVLTLANPIQSVAVMVAFVIGTIPALLAVGFAASWLKQSWYRQVMKVAGIAVVFFAVVSLNNIVQLSGITTRFSPSVTVLGSAPIKNGVQIARMSVDSRGYSPNIFTVKKGVPVRWIVNGKNVFGCQGILVAPTIGVEKTLVIGDNIIEFTPQKEGLIAFSCTMGMFTGKFQVVGS